MRTRSNPVALMIAMIVGLSVTAVSCSPESTSPVRATSTLATGSVTNAQSVHDQYAWTGKYHNDALAYAAAKIKESKKISKFDKCKVGLDALKDFQKAFRKAGGNPVFGDLTLTDGMCEAAGSLSNRIVSSRSVDAKAPLGDISAAANDYMNQVLYQVDIAPSVASLASAIAQIENQATASVDALEAAAVVTSGSITVNSANYWVANEGTTTVGGEVPYARGSSQSIGTGADLTSPKYIQSLSPRTKKMIKADAAAAIGVLLKEWFTGEAAIAKACIVAAATSLIAGIFAT